MDEQLFEFATAAKCELDWTKSEANVRQIGNEVYHHFQIRSTETDERDVIHVDQLVSMMQETAYDHVRLAGLAKQFTDQLQVCWLLTGYTLRLDHLPCWQDWLTVKTWVRPIEKLFFHREFGLYDGAGKAFGFCTSTWFLAEKADHAPVRPEVLGKEDASYAGTATPVFGVNALRLRRPLLKLEPQHRPLLRLTVEYSDLDRNSHVNNTRYITWSLDAVRKSGWADQLWLSGMDIYYIAEAKLQDEVAVYVVPALRETLRKAHKDLVPAAGEVSFAIEGKGTNGQSYFRCLLHFREAGPYEVQLLSGRDRSR